MVRGGGEYAVNEVCVCVYMLGGGGGVSPQLMMQYGNHY